MTRLAGWALPLLLAAAGITLIIVGTSGPGESQVPSLPPIAGRSPSPTAPGSEPIVGSLPAGPSPSIEASAAASAAPTPPPTPVPTPTPVAAVQLEVPSVGINVPVKQSLDQETNNFPPRDAAYILMGSSQPGQNTNSYIFAHANESLFRPLWNVQLGAAVTIAMADGSVRNYVVTEVHGNVPCPDDKADPALNPPDPPLALTIHDDCSEGIFWLAPTPYERITLQTSQGYNRNWGEFVVVAEPAG